MYGYWETARSGAAAWLWRGFDSRWTWWPQTAWGLVVLISARIRRLETVEGDGKRDDVFEEKSPQQMALLPARLQGL